MCPCEEAMCCIPSDFGLHMLVDSISDEDPSVKTLSNIWKRRNLVSFVQWSHKREANFCLKDMQGYGSILPSTTDP